MQKCAKAFTTKTGILEKVTGGPIQSGWLKRSKMLIQFMVVPNTGSPNLYKTIRNWLTQLQGLNYKKE
jgi:hypothetical protein